MDGDVEHVQQQRAYFAAQVAARKCKKFVSVNPVLLWAREAHLDSNPSVLCQEPVDLGGDNCPSVTQEGSPSFQAQEEDGWMDEGRQSPGLGWNKQSCIISASLLLLPPYILSTSIKSNRLLATRPVISHGWASGSHATCIL